MLLFFSQFIKVFVIRETVIFLEKNYLIRLPRQKKNTQPYQKQSDLEALRGVRLKMSSNSLRKKMNKLYRNFF